MGNGEKRSKERITVALIVNVAGGKEKAVIVGKSENPSCFRGVDKSRVLQPIKSHDGWRHTYLRQF